MHQHLVCPKMWTEISYKPLQKDQGFTQPASPGDKGSRDQMCPPVKFQAVQDYKFSTFVTSYQSMETPHRCHCK